MKIIWKITIIVLGGILMFSCNSTSKEKLENSFYKNREGEIKTHASYDKLMEFWDVEYEEDWIQTKYGLTHIVISGPENAPPLFLFPGLFADASMWYENISELANEFRVYALDSPVYGGKSKPSDVRINNIEDYTIWFLEILKEFEESNVAVAGLSYGSWLSLAIAREIPEKISTVIMIDPSETFSKMSPIMIWKGFKYFSFFPNRNKYREFFDWMAGGFSNSRSDLWTEHLINVIEHGTVGMMDVPQHRVYTADELKMITMPVLILVGGKPIIYDDVDAFVESAHNALPNAIVEVIPETGHSLNVEKPVELNLLMRNHLIKVFQKIEVEEKE